MSDFVYSCKLQKNSFAFTPHSTITFSLFKINLRIKILSFYEKLRQSLIKNPKIFLITGVAGFIGSNL